MAWHRSTMLPEYAAFLRKVDRLLQTGVIGKEDVAALRNELRGLMKKPWNRPSPPRRGSSTVSTTARFTSWRKI